MAPGKKNGSKKLLSNSRPSAAANRVAKSMSSKTTRTLIRSHHVLQKQLKQAEKSGDMSRVTSIQSQIEALGGLDAYQKASIQGQANDRGGDSSKMLVEWLRELGCGEATRRRLLEVGSLHVNNACAKSGLFDMVRIDLNSQHLDILQQDFMKLPAPSALNLQSEGFDVISLSLVVNYVPDAPGRGAMLKRTCQFLRQGKAGDTAMPGLFLVLPAPCVMNSRYLDEARLELIMQSLGYTLLKSKQTTKLVYYYYGWTGITHDMDKANFGKQELHHGRNMNNFAIVLK